MSGIAGWLGNKRAVAETQLRWMLVKPRGKAAPGRVATQLRSPAGELVLSEWLVLAGLTLAVLLSRLVKFVDILSIPVIAHFPGLVILIGFALTLMGGQMFRSRIDVQRPTCPPLQTLWPLLLLSAFVLSGSAYLIYVDNEPNTFRSTGMYMLVAYMVARVVMASAQPVRLAMGYFIVLSVAAVPTILAMCYVLVAGGESLAPFHEIEFFILPLAVFWVTRRRDVGGLTILAFWLVMACALLFRKNTAYLVAMGTVVYVWVAHWRVNITWRTTLRSQLLLLIGALVLSATAGAYFYLRHTTEDFVPTGNTEFRLITYARAWNRFLESPVWGAAYLKPAVDKFEAYDTGVANNVLPTHSDLLDMLAHGGLIATLLWALGHGLLLRAVHRHILSRPEEMPPNVVGLTHTLCCMVLLGAMTYAFNPLLGHPSRAPLIWANVGLLAGLVAAFSRVPVAAPPKPRK